MRGALKRAPERLFVTTDDEQIPVLVRRNPRAKRIILRIDHVSGHPVLTLPSRAGLAAGERFLANHVDWLQSQVSGILPTTPLTHGSIFPLRGAPCRIRHRGGRGLVALEENGFIPNLTVPGEPQFLCRRVVSWLKREAKRDLEAASARHAARIRRKVTAVRVTDPKSRWGCCSPDGVLTYSWRLIFAPPHVLNYLAAHEVAHLREMNHSARFWAVVEALDPDYQEARDWLNREGPALSAIGRRAPSDGAALR